jgi:two-component system chemotaxis response regulator CheV
MLKGNASQTIDIETETDELIRLVTRNADVVSQYVVFQNIENEYFAINVAKVEELIEYKTIVIAKTSDHNSLIEGNAKIRDSFVNIVVFDKWLGVAEGAPSDYELAMVCNYSNVRQAIVIKNVFGVMNIEPPEMFDISDKDKKISYLCEILIGGNTKLCKVFDSDRFLSDTMPLKYAKELEMIKEIKGRENHLINKEILIAEDSNLIQQAMKSLLDKMELTYHTYSNGKELLHALEEKNANDIGLIITDLEMPVMGGLELLEQCFHHERFSHIPIVVNTNMASNSIIATATKLGAKTVVNKLDISTLKQVILDYAAR